MLLSRLGLIVTTLPSSLLIGLSGVQWILVELLLCFLLELLLRGRDFLLA
jgi:hypothetical protein